MQQSCLFRAINACLIPLAMLMAGYQPGASAATLTSQAEVLLWEITDPITLQPIPLGAVCTDSSTSGSQAQCVGAYNFASSVFNYNATASAEYGVLRSFGESSINMTVAGSGGPYAISTAGNASFRDQWTITGGEAGTTGTLELSFDITGNYDFSMVDTGSFYGFELHNNTLGTIDTSTVNIPNNSGSLSYTGVLTTNFAFGEVLDFDVNLGGGAVLGNLREGGYDGQTAFLDLSNTAVMNAIVVKDSSGTALPFSLSTASGAVLFDELAAVPVPAAAWLFGSGLLGLIGMARRKKAA